MPDTKHITLRLPASVATRLEQRSRETDLSMNSILVEAARAYLGGEAPPDQRLDQIEESQLRVAQTFADAIGDIEDMRTRLEKIEQLAERQSY